MTPDAERMERMENQVVVTGMGVVTPIGNNMDVFWENTVCGVCGVGEITAFDTAEFQTKFAAEVKEYDPKESIGFKEARRMGRFSQFAVTAADEAVRMAGLDPEHVDSERFGVIVSSGIGGIAETEKEVGVLEKKGPKRVNPLFIPTIISNMAAGNLAIRYQAKGICTSIVTACATGAHSIGEAFRQIKHGYADVMLCGGAEASITPLSVAGFASLTALSKENTDPLRASIPFDKERSGFVMGEGAGVLVLESLEHAKTRGAAVLAEIVGYGATCDAYHITSPAPDGEGGARAMRLALAEAGVTADQISYINAHGTGTPYNDKFETAAIKAVFGQRAYEVPVSSTKSMTGHLLGAAGAVEAAVCIKAMREGFVPATIGLVNPDPECDLDYVPGNGRKAELSYTLSNSLGFGGHNATLIWKRIRD